MKFFNRNFTAFGAIFCIILFFGAVLLTGPAYSEKSADDTDSELVDSAEDFPDDSGDDADKPKKPTKPAKPKKPKKSDKNAAEDFGDGEDGDSDVKPDDKKSNDDEDGDEDFGIEEEHPVIPELEYETYVELAKLGKLDKKQQKKLVLIQNKREKALEKWDKINTKRLEKMKEKAVRMRTESRRRRAERDIEKLEDKREGVAKKFDLKARKVCKKDQLVAYNSKLLYRTAMDEFYEMQFQLSDEQAARVKKACEKYAQKRLKNPKVDLYRDEKKQPKRIYEIAKLSLSKKQFKEFRKIKRREELQRRRELKEEKEQERRNNRRR